MFIDSWDGELYKFTIDDKDIFTGSYSFKKDNIDNSYAW